MSGYQQYNRNHGFNEPRHTDLNNDRKRSASPRKNNDLSVDQSAHSYATKRQNTNSSDVPSEAKSKEQQLKDEIIELGESNHSSKELFIRRPEWDKKMKEAAEKTKKILKPKLEEILLKLKGEEDEDIESDESPNPFYKPEADNYKWKMEQVYEYIDKLPSCRLMDLGFHVSPNSSGQ